jgi:hypothetical protein
VAVRLTGNSFSLSRVYGQSTGTQTVATFTDAGGAGALTGYQPTIDWGDNSTSTGTVGYNTAAPFTFASNLQTGNGPTAVAVADLNGDGHLDIVVANALDHDVQVFLGNGDGSFQAATAYSLGASSLGAAGTTAPAPSPTALAVADLGNGHLDIVTANSNTGTVSVLLGDGTGTFGIPTTLTAGANPSAVALADLGNGHVDIVTANRGDNTVSVFLGNGTGSFGTATSFAAGTGPDGVAIGDVNGDGKPDLVVADSGSDSVSVLTGSDSVSVLIGNGDGTFRAPTTVTVGAIPSAVALAHLTNSGHLDIVTANGADNNVSVLLGNGDGTFHAAVNYAVGAAPVALLVTDANGDGRQDIVTANNGDNNVSVLAGNGDGTFATATNYALATGATAPTSIAAGNLNGAGVLDLVTANSLSNNLTLLLPPYTVTGSHSYSAVSAANTPYQVHVTVAHGTTSATASSGTVTVTPAPLTITADNKTMTYGGTLPALTATFNGLVNGDQPSAVSGLSLTTVPANSHVGSYTITASGGTDSNYTITLANGTLQITAAPLTITADNKSMTYGGALPALTASYSGLVNGDTPATFAASPNTAPTLGTTATSASHVAATPYPITVSGAADNDYTISYVQGGLTVTPATLTITADSKSKTYGGALPALTASYSGLLNGDTPATFSTSPNTAPTVSTTATSASHVAGGPYAITVSGAIDSDYSISYVAGSLTVTPAALTITADNKSMTYGTTLPTFTTSYGGLVNGDGSGSLTGTLGLTTPAAQASAPGNYAITPAGQSSTDYTITYKAGTLTITPAPLSATGQAVSATAGAPYSGTVATFTNADPYGGASSYTALITWGDGSTSSGTISGTGSTLTVTGSHTYAAAGSDPVSVQISHIHGYTTTATTGATATVTSLGVSVQKGQSGGIGFWNNKNGQALLNSFNGGSTATALSAWLAGTFANMFGGLAGMTNAQVAAYYQTQFAQTGPKIGAEVLATALNVYATTSSLGGTAATAYGFKVDAYGLGASTYNVGVNGAAFGVANNTVLNVYQLLLAANAMAVNGVMYAANTSLVSPAISVFDGVNSTGGL